MALTDQPYLPLYVDDWMNNKKLKECSPCAHGLMISVMCMMHKSDRYGVIELKAKFKQTESKIKNFAYHLSKLTSFDREEIEGPLQELVDNEVLYILEDDLICDRMVKDAQLSEMRAKVGSKGGKTLKNSHTRKLYNLPGFLYVIKDTEKDNVFKIGISKDPNLRLTQLSYKQDNRNLAILKVYPVSDMGMAEDNVLNMLSDNRDGEWIFGVEEEVLVRKIDIILSKTKANTENEIENESVYKTSLEEGGEGEGGFPDEPRPPDMSSILKNDKVVPEMIRIYKKYFPDDPDHPEDLRSCRLIAVHLNKTNKWAHNAFENGHKPELLKQWEELAEYASKDAFFYKIELSRLHNHMTGLIKSFKNPNKISHGTQTNRSIDTQAGKRFVAD